MRLSACFPRAGRGGRTARGRRTPSVARGGCSWALAALAALGCGVPRAYVPDPGPYDRVPPGWSEELGRARLDFERGDAHTAYTTVALLAQADPSVVPVRVFLQEIELELLSTEGHLGELAATSPAEARTVLAEAYENAAENQARAEGFVLAARLVADGEHALALLEEADAIDPRCVWVHYGRAWWRFVMRRFKEARESLRTALRLDGGHLPSLRLHATMLAGAGDIEEAAAALEVWLERTAGDPLHSATERADALLDLAAMRVLLGSPGKALELLEELDPRAVRDPSRAEQVRAAAHDARGDLPQALDAVRRASEADPGALLPYVQRALLLRSAGDVQGEREAWERILALTEEPTPGTTEQGLSSADFQGALFRLQALTRLARLAGGREAGS